MTFYEDLFRHIPSVVWMKVVFRRNQAALPPAAAQRIIWLVASHLILLKSIGDPWETIFRGYLIGNPLSLRLAVSHTIFCAPWSLRQPDHLSYQNPLQWDEALTLVV